MTINSNLPYSPDLAPSDYRLFPKLKEHLAGLRISSDDEVKDEAQRFLNDMGVMNLMCTVVIKTGDSNEHLTFLFPTNGLVRVGASLDVTGGGLVVVGVADIVFVVAVGVVVDMGDEWA
ncbi:Hypothetical predicted protein [Octopus vulgaris]|uniref:Histone-lysine N-methyltransferase SETMAR-like n=1 Tax=Octopus vulgaris TaxID=6645 RepID=A0AA36BLD2_OCTVU|nr:Hypothetical predicted protein [Octopus vulgaris]